jgi:TPR repeat protein
LYEFEKDYTKARSYYSKACDLGDSIGCEYIENIGKKFN